MRVIVQRSQEACVKVDGKAVGKISNGLVLLVGFTHEDDETVIPKMVKKIVNLRIFDDENGVMNKSILDAGGEILSISQFTLYADATKGNRPSYVHAMPGEQSSKLYDKFNEEINQIVHTETGIFGADMKITFTADGPVTICLEINKNN
jgi:D-tyrosyl-tRNA(Tyr) deacylase